MARIDACPAHIGVIMFAKKIYAGLPTALLLALVALIQLLAVSAFA